MPGKLKIEIVDDNNVLKIYESEPGKLTFMMSTIPRMTLLPNYYPPISSTLIPLFIAHVVRFIYFVEMSLLQSRCKTTDQLHVKASGGQQHVGKVKIRQASAVEWLDESGHIG